MSQIMPPRWQDLLAHYLEGVHEVAVEGEVEPYQAQPALGLDLATAWQDALLAGTLLGELAPAGSYPDAWQHTRSYQWAAPFPCCVGLAPQFLQQIQHLMEDTGRFFAMTPELPEDGLHESPVADAPWLLRLAVARATGDLAGVETVLGQPGGHAELLLQNERAAQAWFRGDRAGAARLWDELPSALPVIAFNQALAALSRGEFDRGRQHLATAASGFADTTGWRHLADLYRVALGE